MILITNHNSQPQSQEISLQELNKYLQKFYLSARKIDDCGLIFRAKTDLAGYLLQGALEP